MIDSAVTSSPEDAPFVYFSTVSAYGSDLYSEGSSWRLYAREKRHLEGYTLDACERASKRGYPLRLGLVVGANQDRSHRMRRKLAAARRADDTVQVPVAAGRGSNVVHAATVAEAIEWCARDRPEPRTYTVLNEPQWSWRETLAWHAPEGTRLVFTESVTGRESSLVDGALGLATSAVKRYKNYLIPYQVYVPTWLNRRVIHFFRRRNVNADIGRYASRTELSLREFSNRPLSGKSTVPNLTDTTTLLSEQPSFADVFGPVRVDESG
jgi:hypothetical protein